MSEAGNSHCFQQRCKGTTPPLQAPIPEQCLDLPLRQLIAHKLTTRQSVHLQAPIPKQYLELRGQPIATYSMQTFAAMPQARRGVPVLLPALLGLCCAPMPQACCCWAATFTNVG